MTNTMTKDVLGAAALALAVTFTGVVTTPRAGLGAIDPGSTALSAAAPASGLGAAPHDDGSDSGDDGDDGDDDGSDD